MAIFKKHSFIVAEQAPVSEEHSHFRPGCTCGWETVWFECSKSLARERWEKHARAT